jgi:hypothetical protein
MLIEMSKNVCYTKETEIFIKLGGLYARKSFSVSQKRPGAASDLVDWQRPGV